jgi:uncharacterized UPF0160 family protein
MKLKILKYFAPRKRIVTHDGKFHADEIFAVATLSLLHGGRTEIIRTRSPQAFEQADYVVDVGGHYNHFEKMYDHHQKAGAGTRPNGIPYASFGLIWKHYGGELTQSLELAHKIDETLVQPIDANDCGINTIEPIIPNCFPYTVQSIVWTRLPSWREEDVINLNREFHSLVLFAKGIISREIEKGKDNLMAKEEVTRAYDQSRDKAIIILEQNYPFEETLVQYPEPIYVVSPRLDGTWRVGAVPTAVGSYTLRKPFPEAWGGFSNEALQTMTGVKGALFSHRANFLVVAKDKESALKLALLALKS